MKGILRAFEAVFFSDVSFGRKTEADTVAATGAGSRQVTVLVVDDDRTFLETMRSLLRAAGFNVLASPNGPKGLDMLRYAGGDIDALLLDFNMPKFNGADTLEFARKLSPTVKIVAITGMQPEHVPPSFREGVDAFVPKPFNPTELIALLHELTNTKATATVRCAS